MQRQYVSAARRIIAALGAVIVFGVLAAQQSANAQSAYPTKPVQMVVPYPAGGSDAVPRKLAIGMGEALAQPVVIVNKPGASTQIASAFVANATPDGHTLYMSNPAELAAGPALFNAIPFNALVDLVPISYVAEAPYALLVNSKVPAKTLPELIAYMKQHGTSVRFGSYGALTQPDILARRFNKLVGTTAEIIPYQGGSPAFNAMLRDEVQVIFSTLIPTRTFITSGQMTAIAIAATQRLSVMPDLPTLRELGLDIVDQAAFGLVGPKGLPAPIVTRVHEVVTAELQKPDVRRFIEDMGVFPRGSTPAEFAKRLEETTREWAQIVPQLGIQKQ